MDYTLSNEFLQATVSTKGAELQSLRSKITGLEYIWQGDPAFWTGRAPVLFPIIGSLKDQTYLYEGKEYHLPKHGFLRSSELAPGTTPQGRDKLSFLCRDTEETRQMFPFSFELEIAFRLESNALFIDYIVRNQSKGEMYFSIGAHEAFNCPRQDGERFEDYSVVFEHDESPWPSLTLDMRNGLLTGETIPLFEGNTLPLRHELFSNDALIFRHIKSKKLWIKSKGSAEVVEVQYDGADNLGIWTKPGAPYVCIEPWCGLPDYVGGGQDFTKKDGILRLDEGGVYTFTHSFLITE